MREEEPHKIAMRALAALNKAMPSALQMDTIPPEVLHGEELNLDRWTLLINDDTLKLINIQGDKSFFFIDPSQASVPRMFHDYWRPQTCPRGVVVFSCVGAKDISDYGLALVARQNPSLRSLDITGCTQLTDIGIRELGLHCTNLQTLKMTNCHGIEGHGLISIAECCKRLSKLDFSGCRTLQRWSVAKVFYNCFQMEDVNMSNLKDFGDDEVRVLAQNAPNLFSLNARDSPLVSDTSMLVVAQSCPDIDIIDLTRSQFASRVQDVSLLAFSQHCKSLRVLRLSGCSEITDVGLAWLGEGCKALEELDLNGCVKITDAGLRSLGNGCHSLTSIDISHAKLVSDVGINSLSSGCPNLKRLVCHGLYLLSDPRLSAPKKGEKVQPWHSVVGIAALAASCPNMEHIDLTGCFRLNKVLHSSLSSMTRLTSLNLSACNRVDPESLVSVGTSCTMVEELTLSDCGKSVTNAVIAAFVDNCPALRVVVLARCEGIRGGAIRSLSRCQRLEKLDLTGCKSLTDIMMIPLCEVDRVPKLRTLIMVGVHQITDSTVAWVSNKSHNILLFALKGTAVTRQSIQAVKDQFPNSDLTVNDNFVGFWPKFRVEDRKLINHYHAMRSGIVRIQARQRKIMARRYVAGLSERRRVARAVVIIQCAHRCAVAYRRCWAIRKVKYREHTASIVITSVCLILAARKRVRERKAYLKLVFMHACAIKLQVRWRMVRAHRVLSAKLAAYRAYKRRRERAATVIQALGRRYFAVNRVFRIKMMRYKRLEIRERKAAIIQRCFRGSRGRLVAVALKRAYYIKHKLRIACALKIQKKFRIHRTRVIVRIRQAAKALTLHSAVTIQKLMRGALARLWVAEIRAEESEQRERYAAIKIQGRFRVKIAMKQTRELIIIKAREKRQRAAAALTLQRYARSQKARRVVAAKRQAKVDRIRHLAAFELWAVVKIQSVWRGTRGRLRYDGLVREHKGKWKELFDDEKKQRFFYNKLTGEVRWRMPSDLLDLVPHPQCDNCRDLEATFECAVCDEVYCRPCFESVHRGGRRKDHEFRALYDYYGRRLDYGDGVFPCKWPTEIIQDEVQGWMLRVAPVRDPTAVYGGWEEYKEVEASGAVANGKAFYFNRTTFEATYEKPLEIQQAEQATDAFDHSHNYGYYDHTGQWVAYTQDYNHSYDYTGTTNTSGWGDTVHSHHHHNQGQHQYQQIGWGATGTDHSNGYDQSYAGYSHGDDYYSQYGGYYDEAGQWVSYDPNHHQQYPYSNQQEQEQTVQSSARRGNASGRMDFSQSQPLLQPVQVPGSSRRNQSQPQQQQQMGTQTAPLGSSRTQQQESLGTPSEKKARPQLAKRGLLSARKV